jgi:DNA-binding NarL/FixJ family response regulator
MIKRETQSIRLLLVEDYQFIQDILVDQLSVTPGIEVVGRCAKVREAAKLCVDLKPDVLLLDIMLPDGNGLDIIKDVTRYSRQTRVVIFSGSTNPVAVSRALDLKVKGYLVKTIGFRELLRSIRAVAAGQTVYSDELIPVIEKIRQSPFPLDAAHRLTVRERGILAGVAAGKSSRKIAQEMALSIHTVNNHRRRIKLKTGLRSTSDMTLHAERLGLLTNN